MKEKDRKRLRLFAEHLTKIRTGKKIGQRELSTLCEVDYSKINKIENHKANLLLTTLFELADGLGVHPKKLLDFEWGE